MTAGPAVAEAVPAPRAGLRPAVASWSVHVPGVDLADVVPGHDAASAHDATRVHELLGRKGLLYKEQATRLALASVHRALDRPPGAGRDTGDPDPRLGVVVSSNLGNVETVRDIVRTTRAGSARDVSPLHAPNASSNVIASTLAIWFRAGGANLTVCSGATSGLDAVALASLLLRAGRVDRVIVVGVEPDDEVATALHRERAAPGLAPLRGAAACVVLDGVTRGALEIGHVRVQRPGGPAPVTTVGPRAATPGSLDLADRVGDTYGAAGVLHLAVAAGLAARGGAPVAAACGDASDGWRSVVVEPAR